jgi:hypothetical protein
MTKRCLARFLFLSLFLLGPAVSPAAEGAWLTGRVLDPDGTPIAQAAVMVQGESGTSVTAVESGEDGSFFLTDPPSGPITLTLKASGYEFVERRVEPGSGGVPLVVVLPREDFKRCKAPAPEPVSAAVPGTLDFELPPPASGPPDTASAEVKVVQRDGRPIAGATVHTGKDTRLRQVKTTAGGTARLEGLPAGETLWLLIERKGFVSEVRDLKLRPGRPQAIQVTLLPGVRAAGRVVDETGRPVAGAQVALSGDLLGPELPADPSGFLEARETLRTPTDRAGRFHFDDLPEGDVTLLVRHPSSAPRQVVHPAEGGDLGEIVLHRGVALTGRVTDPDDRPVAGLTLHAFLSGMEEGEAPALSVSTGPDGTFALPHVPAGGVKLSACREDYRPLTRNVQPTGQPVHLTVIPAATLRGRVLDPSGRPVAGAVVNPEPARLDRWGLLDRADWHLCTPDSKVTTDAEGRFSAGPLPPDWYDLEVHAVGLLSGRARLLRAAAGAAVEGIEIRLQRDAIVPGRVPAETPALARGRVVGPGGTPIEGALVSTQNGGRTWSAADGSFELQTAGRGGEELSARKRGFAAGRVQLPEGAPVDGIEIRLRHGTTPPAPAEARADLQLPPAHPVSGRVLDDLARPVAGARVSARGTGQSREASRVETGADGSFRFDLSEGSYILHVERPGLQEDGPRDLQVATTAVTDLELRMERATTLRGRLLGLRPGDRPILQAKAIRSKRPSSSLTAEIELDTYSLPGLGPGLWSLEVRSSTCTLRRTIEILPGVPEMEMDLDLAP